jgi:hypothetical protein
MVRLEPWQHRRVVEKIGQREEDGRDVGARRRQLALPVQRHLADIARLQMRSILAVDDGQLRVQRAGDAPGTAVEDDVEMPAGDLGGQLGAIDDEVVEPEAVEAAAVDLVRRRAQRRAAVENVLARKVDDVRSQDRAQPVEWSSLIVGTAWVR